MAEFERLDWLVLKEVARSASGIQPFTLHRRLSITASQLAATISRLERSGFVEIVEKAERIKATGAGIARLQKMAWEPSLESRGDDGGEKVSQDWIWRDQLEINAPYVPKLALL